MLQEPHSDSSSQSGSSATVMGGKVEPYRLEVTEGRSLPSVLKRISNLLALKSSVSSLHFQCSRSGSGLEAPNPTKQSLNEAQ